MSYGDGVQSSVHQAVSSPLRNPLGTPERLSLRAGWSKTGAVVGRTLAHLAGVKDPTVSWRLTHEEPWFDNHISTLDSTLPPGCRISYGLMVASPTKMSL